MHARPVIKLYGERNTCTNYLKRLIELNLPVHQLRGVAPRQLEKFSRSLIGRTRGQQLTDAWCALTYPWNLGWKHTCVEPVERLRQQPRVRKGVNFITITKNPYSWLLSLHRRPYHQRYSEKPDFLTFLQQPWKLVRRDGIDKSEVPTPIDLWNIKNASYFPLAASLSTLSLTAEQIIETPRKVIELLAEKLSVAMLAPAFVEETRSTKDKSKDTEYYKRYYLEERWREELTPEALGIINRHLDADLVARCGYRLLTEADLMAPCADPQIRRMKCSA